MKLSGWEVVKWEEQKDYNGCRVLAKKSFKIKNVDYSEYELINLYKYLSNWYKSICDVEDKIIKLEKNKCTHY